MRVMKSEKVMAEFIQVMTTIDSKEGAQKIAEALVGKRLAACVQVAGPITSTYWWQGEMETAQEWLCIAKTRNELYERVEQAIGEIHSYDTPEIVVLPLITGNKRYLDWIIRETTK
jgi:periplasmic divalent cation tolerance protein